MGRYGEEGGRGGPGSSVGKGPGSTLAPTPVPSSLGVGSTRRVVPHTSQAQTLAWPTLGWGLAPLTSPLGSWTWGGWALCPHPGRPPPWVCMPPTGPSPLPTPEHVTDPARDSGLLLGSQRGSGETRPAGRPGWALSPAALSPVHKPTQLHHAARSQDLLWPTSSGWLHRQKRDQAQAHLGPPHDSSLAFTSSHTPSVPPYTATPSNPQGSLQERDPRPVGQLLGSQLPERKPSRQVWPLTRQQDPSLRAPDATLHLHRPAPPGPSNTPSGHLPHPERTHACTPAHTRDQKWPPPC